MRGIEQGDRIRACISVDTVEVHCARNDGAPRRQAARKNRARSAKLTPEL
jgi:hypothetical protein